MDHVTDLKTNGKYDARQLAAGCVSPVEKSGAFYKFTLRVSADDEREYSFTNRDRAISMREIMMQHMEARIKADIAKSA